MTELERPVTPRSEDKTFRIRLTPKQIEFLIHVLRAYGNLRFDMETRQQRELHFLRDEFKRGGGYQILKMHKQALEDSQVFDFCHPMSIGNMAIDFAELFERILEGGRPHRTWRYKNPLRGVSAKLITNRTRNMNAQGKHNIKVEETPENGDC